MSYQKEIAGLLEQALVEKMGLEKDAFGELESLVEVPKKKENGDFAFPCFRLAKAMRKKPPLIAQELAPHVEAALEGSSVASVSVMGPYLNFMVNRAELAAGLVPAILDGTFLARRADRGERVMIEYSQPNTHKAFHVGHTRNVALGDALWRIYDWNGFETVPVNYIGDEGAHIAKCLWYYRNYFDGEVPESNLGEFLGDLYTNATIKLDFKLLTQCPMPGIVTAKVTAIDAIEGKDKLKRVGVNDGTADYEVVCGGTGYQVGDMVAYARVGSRVAGRRIEVAEKYGVASSGMILSELELGMTEDKQQIYQFPKDTASGIEVAEYFRVKGALPDDVAVIDEMNRRQQGVADTLKGLEAREPELLALWEKTKKWSMDEFFAIYDWLDARFDHYYYESDVGDRGKKIVMDYYEKGVLVKSEGAIGADLSAAKLPFFLLIKSDGSGLYSTKDIALAHDKFEKFGIDRSIYVVDASQSLHFQQVFKTLEMMGWKRAAQCHHLAYGLVVLPEGKMGSRYGNVILFSELKKKLVDRIRSEFLDKYIGEWSEEEIVEAAKRIAVATIKYGMNNQDNMKVIVFNIEEWTARTGNTGPYMMYAFARTRSILRKAGDVDTSLTDWSLLTHDDERTLLNGMASFPDICDRAAREFKPMWLCTYLYQLSKDFSRFFDSCPVLKAESPALMATRLQLVDAVGLVIQKGLALLGIQTLDRM